MKNKHSETIPADQTAIYAALTPFGFDDCPITPGDTPIMLSISLAFAITLEVADQSHGVGGFYSDAPTLTGRAVQGALAIARASMALRTRTIGKIELAAADTVIRQARQFLDSKPRRKDQQPDEAGIVRRNSTLLLLGGCSGRHLAELLGCDHSALQKRYANDLETFERILPFLQLSQ
jgi:hypothetical protein